MASPTTTDKITALYVTYFNRAPDKAGLDTWYNALSAGTSTLDDISVSFAQHPKFATDFGSVLSSSQAFVERLYTNMLGNAGDAAGIAYWTARLDTLMGTSADADYKIHSKLVSEFVQAAIGTDLAAMLAGGSLSQAEYDAAAVRQNTLVNKVAVAEQFVVTLGTATNPTTTNADLLTLDPAYQASQKIIAGVTDSTTTVDAAKAFLTASGTGTTAITTINAATAAQVVSADNLAQTITLTTAADIKTGGAGNDTFNGTLPFSAAALASTATMTAGDSINGGSGTDTLNISISGSDVDAGNYTSNIQTTSVEKILATDYESDGDNVILDLSLVDSALTNIGTTGSSAAGDLTFSAVNKLVAAQMAGTGDLTVTYAAGVADTLTTDAMTLTMNGVGTSGATGPAFSATGVEYLTIDSATASNYATLTTAHTKLTVTGSKNLDLDGYNAATTLGASMVTVDASAFTGGLTVALGVTNVSLTGGSGNDFINAVATVTAADTLAGGSGTDTLLVSDADTIDTAAEVANISGFETLWATANDATSYDASLISGLTKLVASGTNGGNAITFTKVSSTVTDLQVTTAAAYGGETGTEGIIATLQTDTAADSVNLTYGSSTAGVTVVGQTTLNNYETINLISQGAANTTGTFSATSLKTLNVSGAQNLILGSLAGDTALATVDASGMTSTATFTMNATNGSTTAMTMTGTANADFLVGGTKNDTITGGVGNDTITGAAGVDSIVAGDGADSIDAGAGTDKVYGGEANDVLYVGATAGDFGSAETFDGGSGVDTLSFADASQSFTAADLGGLVSVEQITFGATAGNTSTLTLTDAVFTSNATTSLTIDATAATTGALTVAASGLTAANSVLVNISKTNNNAANSIVLGAGNDTVKLDEVALDSGTITGGSGTDTLNITANTGAGAITMAAGVTGFENVTFVSTTDTYSFITDSATVASGATMTVDANNLTTGTLKWVGTAETNGSFVLTGGTAGDTLVGGTMNDTISGGSGADSITGGSGIDSLSGGAGDDIFAVASTGVGFVTLGSAEVVSGGDGNDTLQFLSNGALAVAATDLVGINSIETIATLNTTGTAALTLTDAVFTADGLTTITIDASTATTSGALTVSAANLSAANSLYVNNSGTGVTAASNITLGAGNDTVKVDGVGLDSAVTIAGGSGTDILLVQANTGGGAITMSANITGFEKITFGTVTGTYNLTADSANVASGATLTVDASNLTTGTLKYVGTAETNGAMTMTGGAAADTLVGGTKNDTISAGSGADSIMGGSGADNLTGGAAADIFVYTAVADSSASLVDTIADFTSGTDKIYATLDYSAQSAGLTVDATILTAAAGLSASQTALSGNRGQMIYDTTNSMFYINNSNDTNISSLDYTIGITAASTAANTVVAGDVIVSITGGAGADSLIAGGGADSITGGEAADTIQGGDGNDAIFLAESAATADNVVFNGTAITSAGGNADTVSSYASGTDILTFGSTFLEGIAFGSAQTVTSDVDSAAAGIAGATADNVILVVSDTGAFTTTDLAGMFSSDFTSAMHTLVLEYDGTDSNIYYVGNNLDGTNNNTVAAGECILIGTLQGVDVGTGGLAQANFGAAV